MSYVFHKSMGHNIPTCYETLLQSTIKSYAQLFNACDPALYKHTSYICHKKNFGEIESGKSFMPHLLQLKLTS
jgi:hypothetical protein